MKIVELDTTTTWKARSWNGNSYNNNWQNIGAMSTDPVINAKKLCNTYIAYELVKNQ